MKGAAGFGSFGQNHGVHHYDFSSQIKRAQYRKGRGGWDNAVHVDSHQPTTWSTHWNFQYQNMSYQLIF